MKDSKRRLSNVELSQFIVYICVLLADILMLPLVCLSNVETFPKILLLVIGSLLVVLVAIRIAIFIKHVIKCGEEDSKK